MTEDEQLKKLEDSQILPHATPEDFSYVPEYVNLEAFAEYLKDYLKPTGVCWLCDESLMYEWGLAHGVGHCTSCGMDVTLYHYFESGDKKERWYQPLQTHPRHYSVNE